MKKNTVFLMLSFFIFAACEPDTDEDITTTPLVINFIGTWNRDSMLLNEIDGSGNRSRVETEAHVGWYKFNSGNTGILHVSAGDYAINWNYNSAANTLMISEIDWVNQSYAISATIETKVKLTGKRSIGGGIQEERILYLTKQ